jgi:hypothetical protein
MKKRPNWIDFGILAIVLIVFLLLFMKFRNTEKIEKSNETETKVVTLKVEAVRDYTIDAIEVGDSVYSTDTQNYFGKVKSVEVEDASELMVKRDGELVEVRVPEKYNLLLEVECDVLVKDTGYYADGTTEIKVNSVGTYRTEKAQFSATTDRIEEQ